MTGRLPELCERMQSEENMSMLFKAYKAYADRKRGIIFALDMAHARCIADYYSSHGVRAEVYYGDYSRNSWLRRRDLSEGLADILVDIRDLSVDVPCPEIQFIQLTYPIQRLDDYLNVVESGMRVSEDFTEEERVAGSDDRLLVIDHAGHRKRFGLPTDRRDWNRLFSGDC